ncbi:hypothetical protein MMC25_002453 [Agyrium rufum]|nr:hypothetical protein [Agyrium rufum]
MSTSDPIRGAEIRLPRPSQTFAEQFHEADVKSRILAETRAFVNKPQRELELALDLIARKDVEASLGKSFDGTDGISGMSQRAWYNIPQELAGVLREWINLLPYLRRALQDLDIPRWKCEEKDAKQPRCETESRRLSQQRIGFYIDCLEEKSRKEVEDYRRLSYRGRDIPPKADMSQLSSMELLLWLWDPGYFELHVDIRWILARTLNVAFIFALTGFGALFYTVLKGQPYQP